MNPPPPAAEDILAEAVEIPTAADREAFLDRACGTDAALRARVGKLVADHFRAGSFLERPALAPSPGQTADFGPASGHLAPGAMVGPYRVRELLGEGGMGAVYVADQQEPVKRRVALKVIKLGMDTREVVARFEAERQALALMDHPGIAKVLDGGATPEGRPYFAMELLARYRRVWRRRNRVPLRVLTWPVAGRVWAIDFTGPRPATEGRYPYLLAVRDLASGRQLLWRPAEAATGAVAREALAALFAEYGAPLVLKCDNGSPFTGAAVGELLAQHGVLALYSPPHWPRYNGAVEAGIGSLKDRTDAQAARAGHAGYWTWDDVAGARREANALARPRGAAGPSPDELWSSRTAITPEERTGFRACIDQFRRAAEAAPGPCAGVPEAVGSERAVARSAIRLALERCGYLQYRRRTIPPSI